MSIVSTILIGTVATAIFVGVTLLIVRLCYRNPVWERIGSPAPCGTLALIAPEQRRARALKRIGNALIGAGTALLAVGLLRLCH